MPDGAARRDFFLLCRRQVRATRVAGRYSDTLPGGLLLPPYTAY